MVSNTKYLSRDVAINMLLCGVVKAIAYGESETCTTLSNNPEKPFLCLRQEYSALDFSDFPHWRVIE